MTKLEKAIKFVKELEKAFPDNKFLIVGGAARDIIRKVEPSDFDIATNASVDDIEKIYNAGAIGQSKDFGIISVNYEDEIYEVAEFRADIGSSDGRHPDSVTKVTEFKEDAQRRDFTINSLGYTSDHVVVCHTGGVHDLMDGIIRTVGNPFDRFNEDELRVIRLLRFAATLDFEIEADTAFAARAIASTGPLKVSMERVRGELYKAAKSGPSLRMFIELLDDFGMLEYYLPELVELQDKPQPPEWHPEGDAYVHTLCAVEASRSTDPVTNLATLLHDIGKGTTYELRGDKHTFYGHDAVGPHIIEDIAYRLKIGTQDEKAFAFAARRHMLMHHPKKLSNQKVVSMVNNPHWEVLREVSYADEMSRGCPEEADRVPGTDYSDEAKWVENIGYMIDTAEDINSGGGAAGLKEKMRKLIDGKRLLEWHPELDVDGVRPAIGQVLSDIQEWVINGNKFDATEADIKKVAKRRVKIALK